MCIQLLAHEDLGNFEEAHCWNIQAKFYNEKFPLVHESDKTRTLYHKDHGATLKHKCGKKDSSITPFYFFFGPPFFYLAFLSLFLLGQCSMNDDHHTSIYLQLNDYSSILEHSTTLYECLWRYAGIATNQE